MNKYESIIILSSLISDEKRKEVVDKITTFLNEKSNLTETQDLGKRKLAYEINKQKEGHYYIFEFETNSETITELERLYRISDEVMRFITVRKEK